MTAACSVCKAVVEVRTATDPFLVGEPDEKIQVLAHHSFQGMACKGSKEEVPVPYVAASATSTEGRAMPKGGGKAAPQRDNAFARAGRAEKVRKLTEEIDRQARMNKLDPASEHVLKWLAGLDMHTWAQFAASIKVRTPSAETVAEVLVVYRARAMHAAESAQQQAVAR